jgi:hypothetical protein
VSGGTAHYFAKLAGQDECPFSVSGFDKENVASQAIGFNPPELGFT